jgi:hypothetical protein
VIGAEAIPVETLTQLGAAGAFGIFVILLVREFPKLIAALRNSRRNEVVSFTVEDRRLLRDLHDWHDKEDAEGVKVWYVRRSLEEAITKLSENIEKQTEILTEIHRQQNDLRAEIRREP